MLYGILMRWMTEIQPYLRNSNVKNAAERCTRNITKEFMATSTG